LVPVYAQIIPPSNYCFDLSLWEGDIKYLREGNYWCIFGIFNKA